MLLQFEHFVPRACLGLEEQTLRTKMFSYIPVMYVRFL